MKKIYLMLLCAACVAFVGCNKEEKTPEPTPTYLKGYALIKAAFETGSVSKAQNMVLNNGFKYQGSTDTGDDFITRYVNGNDTIEIDSVYDEGILKQIDYTSCTNTTPFITFVQPYATEIGENPTINKVTCNFKRSYYTLTQQVGSDPLVSTYTDFTNLFNNSALIGIEASYCDKDISYSIALNGKTRYYGITVTIIISKLIDA